MADETKRETLVIRIDWWLGRVIAMTGAITEVAKKRPVKVITSWPLVFWGNPYIKSVHGLDDRNLFVDVIRWNDYFELEPYTDSKFFNDAENWLKVAARHLWVEWPTPQPCLFLAEHEKINNVLCENCSPILFQPFGSTMQANGSDKSYRSIPVDAAQYMADKMIEMGYTPYVVERNDQPKLNWCQQLTVQDLRWLVSLADRYPVVGCDSSMHHAAKAFGKKALVLRAGTDAERYWYESNINMREHPFVAFTPMRLPMNSFDLDICNQHTNKFTKKFLDKALTNLPTLFK